MKVFVSEFLVGGALAGSQSPPSMRREGIAMLQAVVEDISRLPNCSVVTTLERGLSIPLIGEVILIDNASHEREVFQKLLNESDAVLVIAPETDGVLAERCERVRTAGAVSWNCLPSAIELCGDKQKLADHLHAHQLPTIPTTLADLATHPNDETWPSVLKPRDGAGSYLTFLVRNKSEWEHAANAFLESGVADKCLIQPFIAGRALSVGVNISLDGHRIECLPVGEQRLSDDGRFHYRGGVIPAAISSAASEAIKDLVLATCRTIPGLAGYIGVDMLLTNQGTPLIVEINPRLTTAYIGYRQLYSQPLPHYWMSSNDVPPHANPGTVEFKIA